jgi:hypothetical protein
MLRISVVDIFATVAEKPRSSNAPSPKGFDDRPVNAVAYIRAWPIRRV